MIDFWEKQCQNISGNPHFFPWKFEAIVGGILCTGAGRTDLMRDMAQVMAVRH